MDYKELEVWKESKELVKRIYKLTERIPSAEQFGLTNQIIQMKLIINLLKKSIFA